MPRTNTKVDSENQLLKLFFDLHIYHRHTDTDTRTWVHAHTHTHTSYTYTDVHIVMTKVTK